MSEPLVVVCIPTFARPELLEEAIMCFLRQTWENKRLIIGNDYADQTLVFDHPQVLVLNRRERFKTLGEKRNWLMSMAGEDFIAHWDDDDLYLPGHIAEVMGRLPLFKARAAKQHHQWFDNGHAKYRIGFASYMHTIVGHRSVYRAVGDYGTLNMNEDADLLNRMLRAHKMTGPPQQLHEPTFIQRQRFNSRPHMTDFGADCFDRLAQEAASRGVSGTITLCPQWNGDYPAIAAASWKAVQEAACQA